MSSLAIQDGSHYVSGKHKVNEKKSANITNKNAFPHCRAVPSSVIIFLETVWPKIWWPLFMKIQSFKITSLFKCSEQAGKCFHPTSGVKKETCPERPETHFGFGFFEIRQFCFSKRPILATVHNQATVATTDTDAISRR